MLKKIVFVVLLIILAKPISDVTIDYFNEEQVFLVEETPQVINTANVNVEVESADELKEPEPEAIPDVTTTPAELTTAFRYYFDRLATQFVIEYKGNTAHLTQLLETAIDDALLSNPYVSGHLNVREIEYEYTTNRATIHVEQSYLTNPVQEQAVESIVQEIVTKLNLSTMSDVDKVKYVNDYIVQNTVYSEDTVASAHSAYAVAYEGKGVCQGYALFAQKLLTAMGIETHYVVGEVYTGGHAWNLVKVDGEWYHLDITWNDPVPDRGKGIKYNYFLLNDENMQRDHTWERADYPKATSNQYTYMHSMQDQAEAGGFIYFSNEKDENKLYRRNVSSGTVERVGNVRALYIVVKDDDVYFSNYSNGAFLTKMKVDGSEQEILYREEVANLFIEEGYIFFDTKSGKKKIAL